MFSVLARRSRRTAAWRFSAAATAAFAVGTAAAFFIAHYLVSGRIREQADTWLRGESEVLAEVASQVELTAGGDRLVREAAELALREVDSAEDDSDEPRPVFFLMIPAGGAPPLWVGPGDPQPFIDVILAAGLATGIPGSVQVDGWPLPFRVVSRSHDAADTYLGLSDAAALALLREVAWTFVRVWLGMVVFGFILSWISARAILFRVERITETAADIGKEGFQRRVAVGGRHDEISRLGETFNSMLERIEATMQQIRGVTDAVAHDLRSPVTAIRGHLELALQADGDAALRDAAENALDGLDHMLRILNTTLDVAEADAGALRLNARLMDLRRLTEEMVSIYQPAAEEHGLHLVLAPGMPVEIVADADLLRRALANLLDNVLQHIPAGHSITVNVASRATGMVLEVLDDGPGFDSTVLERAFERFVKGPGSQGFGIGLSLVRAAARAHGGRAELGNVEGGGAFVRLVLPQPASHSDARATP